MGFFRLFLALSVVLGHTRGHGFFGLPFVDREVAVQSFFIISGFYMALVLNEKYTFPGRYGIFIQQRFLRLYPTYLIIGLGILAVDSLVYFITGNPWGSLVTWINHSRDLTPGALAFVVAENIFVLGQDVVMLLQLDPTTGSFHFLWSEPHIKPVGAFSFLLNGPAWSLAVEFCFYLVAPFLVCRSWRMQLGITLACLAFRLAVFNLMPFDGYHWVYTLFAPNLYFFMAGSLGYILYKNHGERLKALVLSHRWILLVFALLAIFYSRLPYAHQLYLIWLPIVFIMVPALFTITSKNRTDRLIGELSYPCYLLHSHVLMFTMPTFAPRPYQWMMGPVSIILTLGLAYLFYRFIELRTERFREKIFKRTEPARKKGSLPSLDTTAPSPI